MIRSAIRVAGRALSNVRGSRVVALIALCVAVTMQRATADPGGPLRRTPHLAFAVTLVPEVLVPGTRTSIVVDVSPKRGMHVFAPGTAYRPLTIALDSDPLIRVHDAVYPKPAPYLFKPLNEEMLVYRTRFRVVRDITAGETAAQQAALRERSRLTIKGTLEYQACDATVCYLPLSIPFERTVSVKH